MCIGRRHAGKVRMLHHSYADTHSLTHGGVPMDYLFHYNALIAKHGFWDKPEGVYVERHRQLPGYLGGKYVKGNAFYVSARVHYLAHLLWARITDDGDAWLTVRLIKDAQSGKTSRLYEAAKLRSLPRLREYLAKARKISGDNAVLNKTGVHAASKEQRAQWAKTAGSVTHAQGKGVHAASSTQLSDWGKKAGRSRFKCGECAMVTSCGALGKHQKASGHKGREPII